MSDEPTFELIDFIAASMYGDECEELGVRGSRWWCLRAALRKKWRREAEQWVERWRVSELDAQRSGSRVRHRR